MASSEFLRVYSGYILALILLLTGIVKEALNFKQRKVIRLETEANTKKANLDYTELLKDSYKETSAEWKVRYDEEKALNIELVKANKLCLDSVSKEQRDKADYLEEIHKLREEVQELKSMILKFQAQFPELFKTINDLGSIKATPPTPVTVVKNLDK